MGTAGPPTVGVVDEEFMASTSRKFVSSLNSSTLRARFAQAFADIYRTAKDGDVQREAELLTPALVRRGNQFFVTNLPGEQAIAFAQGKLYMKVVLLYNQTGKLFIRTDELNALAAAFSTLEYQGPLKDSAERLSTLLAKGNSNAVIQAMLQDISGL